jgi:hypothetical protein
MEDPLNFVVKPVADDLSGPSPRLRRNSPGAVPKLLRDIIIPLEIARERGERWEELPDEPGTQAINRAGR